MADVGRLRAGRDPARRSELAGREQRRFQQSSSGLVYLGVGSVAAAVLLYEVALTRIFAIAYGYHFAFLAMSLGLLGFGASGTLLGHRRPSRQPLRPTVLARLAAAASLALVGGYGIANLIPFDPYRVGWEPGQLALLAGYLLCYAIAFLLAGLVLGLPLTRRPERASALYGANLVGSAAGAVIALVVLDRADPPVAVLVAGLSAAVGSLVFACAQPKAQATTGLARQADRLVGLATALLALVGLWQAPAWLEIRLSPYKPLSQLESVPDARVLEHRSSAASRIDVVSSSAIHSAPGLTLQYQGSVPQQSAVVIDGEVVLPLTTREGLTQSFVDGLPNSVAYRLRRCPGSWRSSRAGGSRCWQLWNSAHGRSSPCRTTASSRSCSPPACPRGPATFTAIRVSSSSFPTHAGTCLARRTHSTWSRCPCRRTVGR